MSKSKIISSIKKASRLKTLVLGLLATCLLLSNCTVRKSIEAFLQGSARTESGLGNGFKKIKAIVDNVKIANPQLCLATDQDIFQYHDSQGSKTPQSLLPQALLLTVFLGFITSALLSQRHNINSFFFLESFFRFQLCTHLHKE